MNNRFLELLDKGYVSIDLKDLNIYNFDEYFDDIMNIMLCNLDDDRLFKCVFKLHFTDGVYLELLTSDFLVNLVFWALPIILGEEISSDKLFFPENISNKEIKKYIDKYIYKYRDKIEFIKLNNAIDSIFTYYIRLSVFEVFLCNSMCLEDTITLMNESKEFYDTLTTDFSNIPLDVIKDEAMKVTYKNIDIIKNSKNHCLKHPFLVEDGVSAKQYKEVAINIGAKPDGKGGVYPYIINNSFINGGLMNLIESYIESNTGRIAQILTKCSIGLAGDFARLLGLNNCESYINPNTEFVCDTKNLISVFINDENKLKLYNGRYYSLSPDGTALKKIDPRFDKNLIGTTIYLRSPITCSSAAQGHGICFKCYGDLAYINKDVNVGKLASEIISAILSQKQLSAKHILDVLASVTKWNSNFEKFFNIFVNFIVLDPTMDFTGYQLLIDADALSNDDDNSNNNDDIYILSFDVKTPDGNIFTITNDDQQPIYIEEDLINMIRDSKSNNIDNDDNVIALDMDKLPEHIMYTRISNSELTKTINDIKRTISLKERTSTSTKESLLDELIKCTVDKGGINIDIVHLEVILSNQFRDVGYPSSELYYPKWEMPNAPYQILTLKSSLANSPFITTSLLHQNISSLLTNPNIFDRYRSADSDLYFMVHPQKFMQSSDIDMKYYKPEEKHLTEIVTFDNNDDNK